MRPIALARVRLIGAAQNICGISAQTFAVKDGAPGEDQLVGWVDHLTLVDAFVLVEREGKPEQLVGIAALSVIVPQGNTLEDLLGPKLAAERAAEKAEHKAQQDAVDRLQAERMASREQARRRPAAPIPMVVRTFRDDDGDVLAPEAAIMHHAAPVAVEAEPMPVAKKSKAGRSRKGPAE